MLISKGISNLFKVLILLGISLLFLTCDPGLGKAVDTQAPTVAVEFPVTKSVLKGGFVMKGIATDEVKVSDCFVTFKNMATSLEYNFSATVSNGEFTASINTPKEDGSFELPDGDYNVTVTVSDAYRNSTVDVVYIIDNTAPTVLLTSPNSYSVSNWPNMYKTFSIKGEVYDRSNLESVTVFLVDEEGEVLKSVIADGTNTFLASFDTPFDEEKTCYYYAVAKDAGGNENTYCYHKSDIFQLLSSSKNNQTLESDTSVVFPSINTIGYVDQGQTTNLTEMLSRADLVAKKIENNGAKKVDGKIVFPGFNYFKDNAAQIKWLNISNDVSKVAGIAIGSPVLGTIMPPTDGSAINYSTVRVWVAKVPADFKAEDEHNTPEDFKKYLNENLFTSENELETCVVSEGESGDKQVKLTAVGESLNFQVDCNKPGDDESYWPSGFYYVKVEFTTESGVTSYDFCKFEVTSGAPVLTEGEFAKDKEKSSYYRGYVTSKSIQKGLAGKALTSDENSPVEIEWSYIGTTVSGEEVKTDPYKIQPASDGSYSIDINHEQDGEYTYTLTAAPDSELSTVISRVVVVDTTDPVVEFSTLTNDEIIESSEFTLKGNIEDANGIEKVEYQLMAGSTQILIDGTQGTGWKEIPKAKSSFNLTLSNLKENITYTIKIRATDVAGNVSEDEQYKCNFTIDLSNPVASIDEPKPEENSSIVFVNSIPNFLGKANDSAVTAGKLAKTATLSFTKDGGSAIEVPTGTAAGQFNWNQESGTWTWTPTSSQFNGTGKYDVTLKVTDNAGKSTTVTRTVSLDTSVPTIKLTQVNPYVDKVNPEDGYFVNGEISVKFDITENDYIKSIAWYKVDGTKDSQDLGTNAQPTVKIQTTDFADGTNLGQFKLVVTDRSGNEGVYTGAELSNYEINQDSDKPTIGIDGINPEITTEAGISANNNLFSTSDSISITLKDDDGVASGTYQIDGNSVKTINGGNAKVKTETISLNGLDQGPHTIKLSVRDTNGKEVSTETIYFGIDDKAPELIIDGYSAADIDAGFKNANFDITGNVTDSYELKDLIYSYTDTPDAKTQIREGKGNWTLSITKPNTSEKKTITFVATDKFLRTTVKTFTYAFDLDKPNLVIPEEQRTSITDKYFNQSSMVTLSGTANDVTGESSTQSGLKVVQYGLGTGHNAVNTNSLAYANTNGSAEWTVLLNIPNFSDGPYTLFIKAIDNSGNESDVQKFNITADSTSPILSVGGNTDASGTSYASGDLNLTGTVSDANLEKLTYTYTLNGTEVESATLATSGSGTEKTWSIVKSISDLGDGTHVFKVVATDKAGNQASLTRNIIVDKTPPVITTNVSPQIMYDNGNGEELTVNGTINVNVRVSETNKLKGVYYTEKDTTTLSDNADWSSENSFNETELAAGKTIDIDTTEYTDKSTLPLRIKAVDEAGNYSIVEVDPVVNQESDKPSFTPSNFVELGNESSAGWLGGNPSNVFGDANSNMIFTLSDDDSVKEYWVKVDTGDFVKISDVNSTQQIVTYSVKDLSYGRHTITFIAKDSNCKEDLSTKNNYIEKTYYIAIDDGQPSLTISNANNQYVGSSFKIKGSVSDSNGIKQILLQPKLGEEEIYPNGNYEYVGTEITKDFEFDFTVPEVKDTILITAYDSIGNRKEAELTYRVDGVKPSVTITNGNNAFVDGDTPTLRITGSAVDGDLGSNDNGISGIDQVRLKIGSQITGVNDEDSVLASGKIEDGVMSWSYNLDFTGKVAGSYTVYVQAFDIAGNVSDEENITVYVDTDVPQLSHDYADNFVGVYNGNIVISGTASDASGVKSVTAKIQGASGNLTGTFTPTSNNSPEDWSFTIPANTGDGQLTILVTAKDGCGKSVQETFTATLDTEAPSVTFTDISDDDGNNATIETSKITDKPRVSVTYADSTSGVKNIDYTFYYYDAEQDKFVDYSSTDGNAKGTFTRDKSFSGTVVMRMAETTGSTGAFINSTSETDGIWYVKVTITDEAGNSKGYDSPYFYVDQHKPELEVTSPAETVTLKKNGDSLTVAGTTSDGFGGEIDRVEIRVEHPDYKPEEVTKFTKTFDVNATSFDFNFTFDTSPFIYPDVYEIFVTSYDKAGNQRDYSKRISCDNTAPTITFARPYSYSVNSNGYPTKGNVVNSPIGDTNIKATANDYSMDSIYYQIGGTVTIDESEGIFGESGYKINKLTITGGALTTDNYGNSVNNPSSDNLAEGIVNGTWNKLKDANLDFDVTYNTLTLVNGGYSYQAYGDEETIKTLDVHIVTVDTAGNINYCKFPLKVDTDTDKPTLLMLSPKTIGDVANVGGTATISGTVNDDNAVHSVWMQVELVNGNYVDNILTGNSSTFGIDYTSYGITNPQNIVDAKSNSDVQDTAYFSDRTQWYKVNIGEQGKSTTWNMVLNKNKEFDNVNLFNSGYLQSQVEQTELRVRIKALDTKSGNSIVSADAKEGDISEFTLKIDSGSPSIIINNIADFKEEGSYIGGDLVFDIDFTDDESITEWKIEAISTLNGDNRSYDIGYDKAGSYDVGFGPSVNKKITVSTQDIYEACGNLIQIIITAKDNSKGDSGNSEQPKESSITFKYTIDNTSPYANYVATIDSAKYYLDTEAVRDGANRETNARGNHLRIISEQAALKGNVLDETNGSSVDFVMVYFTKEISGTTYLYNPSKMNSKTVISTTCNIKDYRDSSSPRLFPVKDFGDIVRTAKIDGSTPYIIVDRAEGWDDDGANGDFDGYSENLKANGEWVVYFNSTNLPDSVYDVHYVVVDYAGNARYYSDTMLVQNNPPTINSIVLATDIDGDGFVTSSTDGTSDEDDLFNSSSYIDSGFIVRNSKLNVRVNATGGTGTKKYYLTYPAESGNVTLNNTTGVFEITSFPLDEEQVNPENYKVPEYIVWVEDSVETNLSLSSGETIIEMIMDNNDSVSPVAQLFELNTIVEDSATSNEDRGSLYKEGSTVQGHIEPREFSKVYNVEGQDPDVSGKIILRGEVMDNQRIGSIKLTLKDDEIEIAKWNNSTDALESQNNNASITSTLGLLGHHVEWSYVWDTNSFAAENVEVSVKVEDITGNVNTSKQYSSDDNIPHSAENIFSSDDWGYNSMTVDVVPYITKIETPNRALSGLKKNNIRSASGKYSVIKGNTADFIKVYGFNLNASAVRIVDSTEVYESVSASTGNSLTTKAPSSPYNELSLSNNSSVSGYLEIIVNGVRSINNINDNEQDYNQEPDESIKNTLLNDDRYLLFFNIKDTGIRNGYYPTMVMEGNNPVFGYLDKSGGKSGSTGTGSGTGAGSFYPAYAMPQRAKFDSDGKEIYVEYLAKNSVGDLMGMGKDDSGRYHHVTVFDRDKCAMYYVYDRYAELVQNGAGWAPGVTIGTIYDFVGRANNNGLALESVNYKGLMTGRYMYPKVVAKGDSINDKASVYMAYYDDFTKEILLRNFQVGKNSAVSGTKYALQTTAYNVNNADNDGRSFGQYVNFAENTCDGSPSATYSTGRLTAVAENTNYSPSRYFDIKVTSDNHIIIVYYDQVTSSLQLLYSNNAIIGATPTSSVAWTRSSVNFPLYVGTYVSMDLDKEDGIHITAFDANDSDLYYMYLPKYDSQNLDKMIIDQYGSVGHWTQIKIDRVHTSSKYYNKPVVAYYNSTETGGRDSIKLAYVDSNTISAGVDSNGYVTGSWEFMTVPALTSPQGGDPKFQNVCLDFDSTGKPIIGYLGENLEFGTWCDE